MAVEFVKDPSEEDVQKVYSILEPHKGTHSFADIKKLTEWPDAFELRVILQALVTTGKVEHDMSTDKVTVL